MKAHAYEHTKTFKKKNSFSFPHSIALFVKMYAYNEL